MRKTILSFLLLLVSTAWADDSQTLSDMRLSSASQPLATVYGCVNVVTGDFFLSDHALQVNSVVPMRYGLSYDSGDPGTDLNKHHGFGVDLPLKIAGIRPFNVPGATMCKLYIEEQQGANIVYTGQKSNKAVRAAADSVSLNKHGYTNFGSVGIAGCDCLKKRTIHFTDFVHNQDAHVDQNGNTHRMNEITGGTCKVTLGSGRFN